MWLAITASWLERFMKRWEFASTITASMHLDKVNWQTWEKQVSSWWRRHWKTNRFSLLSFTYTLVCLRKSLGLGNKCPAIHLSLPPRHDMCHYVPMDSHRHPTQWLNTKNRLSSAASKTGSTAPERKPSWLYWQNHLYTRTLLLKYCHGGAT